MQASTVPNTGFRADDTLGLNNLNNEVNAPVGLTTVGGAGQDNPSTSYLFGSGLNPLTGEEGAPGANSSGPYGRLDVPSRSYNVDEMGNNYRVAPVFYVDQILPFDIAIVAANEYGQSAQMRLYGCEILNEGSGFSIDDIVIENQMTYVCRTILPWRTFEMRAKGPDGKLNMEKSARDQLYGRLGRAENRGGSTGGTGVDVGYNSGV